MRATASARGLSAWIASVAAGNPDKVAVQLGDSTCSYAELERRANRVASRLRRDRVGAETLVGVCMERSIDLVAALLGVVKAGAAYVPLDPTHPRDRLDLIVHDAGCPIVLTSEPIAARGLFAAAATRIVATGGPGDDLDEREWPPVDALRRLAYVIYTSGSTGRPKGVQIEHAALSNFLGSIARVPGMSSTDTLLAVTTVSFDIAALELWLPLCVGGTVVLATAEQAADGRALRSLVERARPTIMQATPATWRMLLNAGWRGDVSLRALCGGEALPPALAAQLHPRVGSLWNLYGPTETTIWSAARAVTAGESPVVVGGPIDRTQLHILDEAGQPCADGATGEIFIGGAGVARGYWSRPALTAERFVPDHLSATPGARLYRTGDLARRRADGTIEFLGRADHQVKLRGFRIELGEIEAVLADHPDVESAVAVVREDRPDDVHLVGYVVRSGPVTPAALRDHLAARLPPYMVPSAIVPLQALPLTPNRKVDRAALPRPDRESLATAPYQAPVGEVEEAIAAGFRDVLGIDVGRDDDFFQLGGDSLAAARIVNRLAERFEQPLFVAPLFDNPTVASYAHYLGRHYGVGSGPGAAGSAPSAARCLDESSLATLRGHLHQLSAPPPPEPDPAPNPRAIFLLAPPRSGTSLLRTMLAGHPGIFAASELRLLSFHDLEQRRRVLSGRYQVWRDGTIRTLMELEGCTPDAAKAIERDLEVRGWTTKQYFHDLQRRLGSRILLDKTTDYALDREALAKAERDFDRPFYIHLVRHPHAVARSFAELRMDQVYVFREPPPFSPVEIGELFWLFSHRNAVELLREVPEDRQIRVQFEQLVVDPEATMRQVCRRIGLDYCDAMIRPYDDVHTKMVDGVYPESKPMGDERFLTRSAIDAAVADKSTVTEPEDFLSDITWELAEAFGYPLPGHRARARATRRGGAIPRAPRDGALALSFPQQRMWLLHQLDPDSAAYNMPLYHRLRGPLDRDALRRAIEAIVWRHEALRTTFPATDGVPRQHTTGPAPFDLPVEPVDPGDLEHRVAREQAQPFDLETGPLIRARLLELGREDHVLLITMHHIVSDGWSITVFWRELRALYAALCAGDASPLPALRVQYADYAAWQRRQLSASAVADQLAYWTRRLAGGPDEIELPFRRPRTGAPGGREARLSIEVDGALAGRLRELGGRHRASLFMTLLAGFRALLFRHCGQHDISIGTPIAGRQHGQLEDLIGLFVNTLVMRTQLTPELSFDDLVDRERQTALEAYAHQDVPFESVVDALRVERSLDRNPVFQVWFVHHNMPREPEQLGSLASEPLARAHVASKFDLSLYVTELDPVIRLTFAYDERLFARESIETLAAHLHELLAAAARDPQRPVIDIALGPAPAGSDPTRPIEHRLCSPIHHAIEDRVAEDPGAVAVRSHGREWTRHQLWSAAGDVATAIASCALGSGARVAVTGVPSVGLIAAVLGTLRSGGCLVPLSPRLDPSHRQRLLRQAQVRLVVETSLAEPLARLRLVDPVTGAAGESWPAEKVAVELPSVAADAPAYVYFTSGTTGAQKGVVGTHDGLSHFISWQTRTFAEVAGPVCAQLTHLGFDVFLRDVLFPLTSGKLLTIPDAEVSALAIEDLMRWLDREQVTAIHTVPSLARAWLNDCPDDVALRSLRCVFIAGEPLPASLVDRWRERFGADTEFINLYGPTETTLAKCWYRVPTPAVSGIQPIGQPLPGTEVLILREGRHVCAAGEPGEIVIRTPYRTRGYLDPGASDARRFTASPFRDDPDDILYRTGDRGMVLTDGTLAILGRIDDQVKIRGQRVDPAGIAAMLMSRPGVAEAAVTAVRVDADDIRLAAYVVPARGANVAIADLEQFLRASVPAYMVPAAFAVVDSLPRTASGKLDRRALPAPAWAADRAPYIEPRDPREQALAEIWARLLGVDRVGVRDDFFALGGHSLLATQAVSRIRNLFGVELPLRRFFESPTVEKLAREIAAAGPDAAPALPAIERAERGGELPLSFAQQRLWFLHQLDPDNPAYAISHARRLRGSLEREALRRAIEHVVHRHDGLRGVFSAVDGVPHQTIVPAGRFELPCVDLPRDGGEPDAALERVLAGERRPFDVEHGPLVRAVLIRVGTEHHVLAVSMHHIVSDGWSMGVFWRELAAAYTALEAGGEPRLAELGFAYTDYALWQRRWLSGPALERQLAYWRQRLAGSPEETLLPTNRVRPPVQSYRGSRVALALDAALSARLAELARREGASLFMTLLAGFRTVLARYTGQADVVIGTPIAGRHHGDVEDLIGLFVNTLPLRHPIDLSHTFRDLLRQERDLALEAYAHQDAPFELVVDEIGVERSLSRPPLVQVVFAHQNVPRAPDAMGRLITERVHQGTETAKFDLSVSSRAEAGRIELSFVYNTDLFDRDTIEQLAGHLAVMLEAACAQPARRLSELSLLTADERRQVVFEWNDTACDHDLDGSLHELVERRVDAIPDDVAIELEGETLSYRAVDERANRLAHALVACGVGPETVVGVHMERCLDLVPSLLAVSKAGGAWVPLDPGAPAERTGFMLADSRARVLITGPGCAAPAFTGKQIDVIADATWIAQMPAERPRSAPVPDQLAYVLYTSGSSGRPKGSMITHRAIRNRLLWTQRQYPVAPDDVVIQKTPFTFDLSLWECFGTLLAGARLVLARPEGQRDPAYLAELMKRCCVTTIHFVPSMLRSFLAEAEPDCWRSVRRVYCGGEALTPALRDALAAVTGAELINQYGPTETAVDVSSWRCLPGEPSIPIGRPVDNTRLYVLDDDMEPVPPLVCGELYVGGVQVGRGYWRHPRLTAERFVPDPFGPPGSRLYRTGDRVRARPDGAIEFLGRIDFQIKLRGFRIELGEVEAVIRQVPGVRDAVALVREVAPGDQRLVVYVAGPADLSAELLRQEAATRLPHYMIPSAFVVLDALPVMTSGKLDRKALPEPAWAVGAESTQPRSPHEQAVAEIWSSVLGVDQVGIRDDFFDVGGHSLLATQLVSRIRKLFGVDLSLHAVFEAPTIEQIAAEVQRLGTNPGPVTVSIDPVPRDGVLPLSYAQQRMWFLHQLRPRDPTYHMRLVRRLRGPLDPGALRSAFETLIARHEALRTVFPAVDGVPRQHILPPQELALSIDDISAHGHDSVASIVTDEADSPFDLARGPLLRARLWRLGADEHLLVITMHHIVADGWSMAVFWRELAVAHTAATAGKSIELPVLPVQYADYAAWQRRSLTGPALESQLAYWTERLRGAPDEITLPMRGPRPSIQTFRGARETVALDRDVADRLRELGRREGATLFMTLLAAVRTLLARYSDQGDLVIGTPIAGRQHREIEGLIGCFVNTLALRNEVDVDATFSDLLRRERELALAAYAHQDTPFELVVDALGLERSLSRPPLVQVLFAHQNMPRQDERLGDVAVERLDQPTAVAKVDLAFFSWERAGAIDLELVYNADLFDAGTAAAMGRHLRRLLCDLTERGPATKLSDLELMAEPETRRLVSEWSRGREVRRELPPFHVQFAQVAARAHDAVAVSCADDAISFGELDRRANQLANHLRAHGVGPETAVAVVLGRSIDLVIAMLAVSKAGGAWVPLDVNAPRDRLVASISACGAVAVITMAATAARLQLDSPRVVRVDDDAAPIAACSDADPAVPVDHHNLAYIIFTSGSTGQPKGVAIEHGAIANSIAWHGDAYAITAASRGAQSASPSFDAAVLEIWPCLCSGAGLYIVSDEVRLSAARVIDTFRERGITHAFLPPMVAEAVLRDPRSSTLDLSVLLSGADRLSQRPTTAHRFRYFNNYGPTENAVVATWMEVPPDDTDAPPPIGYPVDNVEVHVLDRNLVPVPPGAAGELYLGGVQLARGYVGRPAETAARFVPHPFGGPGSRLYRTGDRARFRGDGSLDFLGRVDDQVKIRGFRIELGDVESAMSSLPGVDQAVVVVRELAPGDRRLVGYVVGPDADALPALRAALRERLPDYMIPAHLVSIDRFPLTRSGKIDRNALPAPAVDSTRSSGPAPHGQLERTIAQIWCEVLSVGVVSATDNFFDVGGNSMSLVTVHDRLQARLEVEFPLVDMFQYPTVASLARFLADRSQPPEPAADAMSTSERARRRREHHAQRLARRGSKLEP